MLEREPATRPADGVLPGLPRRLGSVGSPGGPTLVCIGGLHGNEPPGVLALLRILGRLRAESTGLAGRLVALSGNRRALARGERYLDDDLNRIWLAERVERVRQGPPSSIAEEEEMWELSEALDRELSQAAGAHVLDLHSTSGEGPAFVTLDDTLANRAFAMCLPAPHVLGLEEELAGTLLGHLVARGITAIGFEAGQHSDPASVDRAEAAVWIAMETCGVLERGRRPEVDRARRLLSSESRARPGVVEVRYRHAVEDGSGFRMLPGRRSFERVRAGELLANDSRGPIVSPVDGMILMPLYQDRGDDGFFVIRRVNPAWLGVSAWLRRSGVDRFAHWLPGVRRHPERPSAFSVDRSRARWLALQVFHLLGYRRQSESAGSLVMVRRDGGRPSAGASAGDSVR